ncbi:IWS1-like protein [Pyrus ussuriensis x Pyrus communis]|uniref:IWS1-like protein n=1 Tax=Pyrus ussuriensis x Pyrus communis TaxID=2448454 RepID=A0A5N5IJJ3_9ROSA|nr:IWS1-like protein [Pyrus ussuriensis x Pyrus communis]
MDNDDDFKLLLAEAALPVHQMKLKRLKKAIKVFEEPLVDELESGRVNPSKFESLSLEESNEPSRLGLGLEGLGGERDSNYGFDSLGGGEGEMSSSSDGLGVGGEIDFGFDGLGGEGEMNSSFDGLGGGEDGNGAKRLGNVRTQRTDGPRKHREVSGTRRKEGSPCPLSKLVLSR